MSACAAGIDVGKNFLDVGMAPTGHNFRVPNAPKGVAVVVERLRRFNIQRVVLEAIGPYGAALIAALRRASAGKDDEVRLVSKRKLSPYMAVYRAQYGRKGAAVALERDIETENPLAESDQFGFHRHALMAVYQRSNTVLALAMLGRHDADDLESSQATKTHLVVREFDGLAELEFVRRFHQ